MVAASNLQKKLRIIQIVSKQLKLNGIIAQNNTRNSNYIKIREIKSHNKIHPPFLCKKSCYLYISKLKLSFECKSPPFIILKLLNHISYKTPPTSKVEL